MNSKIIRELYQSYPRFNVLKVYKIDLQTNEKKFLYTETEDRTDFGKKLFTRKEMISELNKMLEKNNLLNTEDLNNDYQYIKK